MRISVRDKSKTETLICENFIGDLLMISESPFCTDFVSPLSLVPAMALRCLINMMNGNFAASELFIRQNLNGLNRILAVLQLLGMNLQYSAMMHFATKLLYMLLSQRFAISFLNHSSIIIVFRKIIYKPRVYETESV